jgi:GNAT superfamily N-acetyltransferase
MPRIELLADHPSLVDTIARWHWEEWGHADPGGSLEGWTSSLRREAGRDSIPMAFAALDDDGSPVGSVSLVEHDMPDRADLAHLRPWVGGTFVVAHRRGEGLGRMLMLHVQAAAAEIGVSRLSLHTSTARSFYERLGWTRARDDVYEGERVVIMTRRLPTSG